MMICPPGFRRLPDGAALEMRPLLPEGVAPAWLDRVGRDGFTHRQRIDEASTLVAAIAGGWRPAPTDLDDAPLIDHWMPVVADDGVALLGKVVRHPVVDGRGITLTSRLLAIDGHGRWARTISRFYALGRPIGTGDQA